MRVVSPKYTMNTSRQTHFREKNAFSLECSSLHVLISSAKLIEHGDPEIPQRL